jgi:hypothetical protein
LLDVDVVRIERIMAPRGARAAACIVTDRLHRRGPAGPWLIARGPPVGLRWRGHRRPPPATSARLEADSMRRRLLAGSRRPCRRRPDPRPPGREAPRVRRPGPCLGAGPPRAQAAAPGRSADNYSSRTVLRCARTGADLRQLCAGAQLSRAECHGPDPTGPVFAPKFRTE